MFVIVLGLVISLVSIGLGFYGLKRQFPGTKGLLRKYLAVWNVFADIPQSPQQKLEEIEQSWNYLNGVTAIGMGIGVLLIMLTVFTVIWMTARTMDENFWGNFFPVATFYGGACLGGGIGAAYAVRRLRATVAQNVTYADLVPRQLTNYRSRVIRWLVMGIIIWMIIITCFFIPYIAATTISILPIIMTVVFIVVEQLLARIATASRLLITGDPLLARRVDDMLRARVIGLLQFYELGMLGYLMFAQRNMLWQMLQSTHNQVLHDSLPNSLLLITLFLAFIVTLLGSICMMLYGRLGGSISGWPWQSNPMMRNEQSTVNS